MITRRALDDAIRRHRPVAAAAGDRNPAAVLVPFSQREGAPHVLFTMRPRHLRAHGGQVSFPGGRIDPGDATSRAAALREAWEELRIPPDAVDVVGRLDDLPTITDFHVTPWVGWVEEDVRLEPSPSEVAEAFWVPLSHLMAATNQRTMQARWRTDSRQMRFYLTERHVIWGATATMLSNLLDIIRR